MLLVAQMESRVVLHARSARILKRWLDDGSIPLDEGNLKPSREAMRIVVERCVNLLAAMAAMAATREHSDGPLLLKERMLEAIPWLNAKEVAA